MTKHIKAFHAWPKWYDPDEGVDIYYALSASKARYEAYLGWGECNDELSITDIKVRRCPEEDRFIPDEHRLVKELSPGDRQIILHSYGADRFPNDGQRNHFCTAPGNSQLLRLSWEIGLFDGPHGHDGYSITQQWVGGFFYLTELGREVARSMLHLTPEIARLLPQPALKGGAT